VLDGANLQGTAISNSWLIRASLVETNLRAAVVDDVNFRESLFRGVDFAGATFVDSRFDFADLSGEKLDGVVFEAGRHEAVGGRLDELFSLRWL